MTLKHKRRSKSPATKLAELGVAAPQVVAHRLTRMALAGPVLSGRDRREFTGMVTEKQLAFAQAWVAMLGEAARQQQALAVALMVGSFAPQGPASALRNFARIVDAGIAPVHGKAVSNARRLGRSGRR